MGHVTGTVRSLRATRSRWLLVLILFLALPLAGCSSGEECDTCSTDEDCEAGLVCTEFSDGSMRCGSGLGASTCKVR